MLYAMCGLSFSGKSTLARRLAVRAGAVIVSLDDILAERGLHGGDGVAVEDWERASWSAVDRVRALAASGSSVVLDDTCSLRFLRERYRQVAEATGLGFRLVYLDVPLEELLKRMEAARVSGARRLIAAEVFEAHRRDFEPPGEDEAALRFTTSSAALAWLEGLPQTGGRRAR